MRVFAAESRSHRSSHDRPRGIEMARLGLILTVVGLLLFLHWFRRTPSQQVARALRQTLLWIGSGLLVLLAVRGPLPPLFAVLGLAIPFLAPLAPGLFRRWSKAFASAGRASQDAHVRFLRMERDQASGTLSGQVLAGRFRGRYLGDLSLAQLLELHRECAAADPQSKALLEAYLDRRQGPGWRRSEPDGVLGGRMTREEAYAILGVAAGAQASEIVAAHRHLMQHLHPDRGGSTWLAAKINQAKDLLLGG